MKLTESMLRKIIREEARRLNENKYFVIISGQRYESDAKGMPLKDKFGQMMWLGQNHDLDLPWGRPLPLPSPMSTSSYEPDEEPSDLAVGRGGSYDHYRDMPLADRPIRLGRGDFSDDMMEARRRLRHRR